MDNPVAVSSSARSIQEESREIKPEETVSPSTWRQRLSASTGSGSTFASQNPLQTPPATFASKLAAWQQAADQTSPENSPNGKPGKSNRVGRSFDSQGTTNTDSSTAVPSEGSISQFGSSDVAPTGVRRSESAKAKLVSLISSAKPGNSGGGQDSPSSSRRTSGESQNNTGSAPRRRRRISAGLPTDLHPAYTRKSLRVNSAKFAVTFTLVNNGTEMGTTAVKVDVYTSVGSVLDEVLHSGALEQMEDVSLDRDTEWAVWVEGVGDIDGRFFLLTEQPFSPFEPTNYSVRKITDRPKKKLGDILGVSGTAELNNIRENAAQQLEDAKAKDLISKNAKLDRFFGNGSESADESSETDREANTGPIAVSKTSKAVSLLGVTEENKKQHGGGEVVISGSARRKTFDRKAPTLSQVRSEDALFDPDVARSHPKLNTMDSEVSLSEAKKPTGEKYKRTGKLADFFGVQGQQEVSVIRKTLRMEYADKAKMRRRTKESQDPAGQALLRVNFGNETYKVLRVTTVTNTVEVVEMLLEKMMLKAPSEDYGLFEVAKDGSMRQLDAEEVPFEVMRRWQGPESFLFKKVTSQEKAAVAELRKKQRSPVKTVAKLAGFFGVAQGLDPNQAAQELPTEFAELLTALTGSGNSEPLIQQIAESTQTTVHVKSRGRVAKEGWLYLEDDVKSSARENCWCQIKNNMLVFQPGVSKNESVEPEINHGVSVPLMQCTVEGPAPSTTYPGKHRFTVTAVRCRMDQSFATNTIAEAESWVTALQTAVKNARNTMNLADLDFHKVIGRGQYGKVLLCSQHSTNRVYAVKVIDKVAMSHAKEFSVPDNVILEGIKHPFIVTLHCAFDTGDRLFLVMEYINGGEIFYHVSNYGRFTEKRTRFYAAEIFLAIEYLHKCGVMFRDLKLENLMLTSDGHVKLADFGLSTRVDSPPEPLENGIPGTTEYLAPEIIAGKPWSFAGDWWAYGLVVFEMLCGYHPFYSDDRNELYQNILKGELEFPPFASPLAIDLLSGLLKRNPIKRLGSAGAAPTGGPATPAKIGAAQQASPPTPASSTAPAPPSGLPSSAASMSSVFSTTSASAPSPSPYTPDQPQQIKEHPFFTPLDFGQVYLKRVEPPFLPAVNNEWDTRYFDEEFLSEKTTYEDEFGRRASMRVAPSCPITPPSLEKGASENEEDDISDEDI